MDLHLGTGATFRAPCMCRAYPMQSPARPLYCCGKLTVKGGGTAFSCRWQATAQVSPEWAHQHAAANPMPAQVLAEAGPVSLQPERCQAGGGGLLAWRCSERTGCQIFLIKRTKLLILAGALQGVRCRVYVSSVNAFWAPYYSTDLVGAEPQNLLTASADTAC
jgi:hypothetical protein